MAVKFSIKHIFRLFVISAKMDLAWFLRDTKFALTCIFADMFSNMSTISGILLISSRFEGIGGLSTDEILFMMGYSTIITGLFIMFGSGNNIHISRIIGRGQLEHLFMQPLSIKTQLFTCGFCPFTGGSNFFIGIIMLVIAIHRLSLTITIGWVIALICYVIATMTIIIARSYLFSAAAFYAPVEAEEISTTAVEGTWFLSTFPLSGMPNFIKIPLLTILPEGLMAWFPSICLLGKQSMLLGNYYPFAFAFLISLLSAYIFRKGLRYYVRKGSNRYLPYGYRR